MNEDCDDWFTYPRHKPEAGIDVLVCQNLYGDSEQYFFVASLIESEFSWSKYHFFSPCTQHLMIQRDAKSGDRWKYIYGPEGK